MRIPITIFTIVIGLALSAALKTGDDVTVSGLSSGGFMAVQMHIANSATIRGAGVFAGGPYYCAKGDLTTALTNCMYVGTNIDLTGIKTQIKSYEKSGKIDSSSNLLGQKAFIFSGVSDYTVVPKVAKEAEKLYKDLGVSVITKYDLAASHTMPTTNYGVTCGISMPPYIGKCNYNGAFEALNVLFDGKLKKGSGKYNKANLYSVPQNGSKISMGSNAYVYVPTKCKESDANCPVHVVFHGCKQSISDIQMQYVENTGYNEIAEDNNFVILYPQAIATTSSNPNGCWDWWGYLDADYANQSGPQISEVNRLINELKNGSIRLTSVEIESHERISDFLTPQ